MKDRYITGGTGGLWLTRPATVLIGAGVICSKHTNNSEGGWGRRRGEEGEQDVTTVWARRFNNNLIMRWAEHRTPSLKTSHPLYTKPHSLKMKQLLDNSNVESVLLYGSESWRVVKTDRSSMEVFHNGRLRRIRQILWCLIRRPTMTCTRKR